MKFQPTSEQQAIVTEGLKGSNLCVKAFAGAAKSTTCRLLAEALAEAKPNQKILGIAFNKSIAEENKQSFPSNTVWSTMHSLAWRAVIKRKNSPYDKRLEFSYNWNDVQTPAGMPREGQVKFKLKVIELIKGFCSSDNKILMSFLDDSGILEESNIYKEVVRLWNTFCDESAYTKITPDIYLKLYHLSNPILDYNVIMLDEAQDSNPVTLDIILKQKHAQVIIVGDEYQSIYEWRGAVNALASIPSSFKHMYLTESFRFTQAIAEKATSLTSVLGNSVPIIGKAEKKPVKTRAILARKNSTIVSLCLQAYNRGEKVNVLADFSNLWKQMYHLEALYKKEKPKYPAAELLVYKDWDDITDTLKETRANPDEATPEGIELISLTDLFFLLRQGGLYNTIQNIKSILVSPKEADYSIATAWKSKGLEWGSVTIHDDLMNVGKDETIEEFLNNNQKLQTLYVALTRAKYEIHLPYLLQQIIDDYEGVKDWIPNPSEQEAA